MDENSSIGRVGVAYCVSQPVKIRTADFADNADLKDDDRSFLIREIRVIRGSNSSSFPRTKENHGIHRRHGYEGIWIVLFFPCLPWSFSST